MTAGTLSVVATPIGNLEDITYRAVRTLSEADRILSEDTRTTKILLDHYRIDTELMSYPADTGRSGGLHPKAEHACTLLGEGKHLALVSEAGTPGVSDPGARLVSLVRERFGSAVTIEAVPGPSALTAALSISGIPASPFVFLGYLPHKKGRETIFEEIATTKRPVIFYESRHRIQKALASLASRLSAERRVMLAREMTKMYEEMQIGSAAELAVHLDASPEKTKGEFVVIVEGE